MSTEADLVASPAHAWSPLARLEDLEGDGPFALSADGIDLVVVRAGAGLKAYEGRCPHQGALLGEGEMDGGQLVCRNHRWRFDAQTGHRAGGPQCLRACPVELRDGMIQVNVAPLRSAAATRTKGLRRLSELPGPKQLPVIGNMLQIEPDRMHLTLERWAAEHGPIFVYRVAGQAILGIADPEISTQILRDRPETYRRASQIDPILREIGVAGVFSAEGAEWRPQRRLAMHALSHRNLRGFYPNLQLITRRLRERWLAKAREGAVLDIVEEMKRFTVDVTTLLVFGYDTDTIGKADDVIQQELQHILPAVNRRIFAVLPTWRWFRTPADRRVDRAMEVLREWLGGLIADARLRVEADSEIGENPSNFLESMLAARDAEGRPFSDELVFGNAMTMLLAGEDTTANTLAWAVHLLADAPEIVDRLREEADRLGQPDAVPLDLLSADDLAYAGAVANEAMRLRPVAPVGFLETNTDVVVGDVHVPAGTWIAVLTRTPAIDERHFAEPLRMMPERWLGGVPGAHEPSAHIPFGSGPRICPGRTLALVEMKAVLTMLYGNFDVEQVGAADEVEERLAFTMNPRGLRVRLRARSDEPWE